MDDPCTSEICEFPIATYPAIEPEVSVPVPPPTDALADTGAMDGGLLILAAVLVALGFALWANRKPSDIQPEDTHGA